MFYEYWKTLELLNKIAKEDKKKNYDKNTSIY